MKKKLSKKKNIQVNGRELLKQCSEELEEKEINNPNEKAEYFLIEFLNCRRIDLYLEKFDLNQLEAEKLKDKLSRLKDNEPVQYVTNSAYFLDFKFYIKNGMFIPRPETEILVREVINHYNDSERKILGVDIGTGCGNIAISLVKKLSDIEIEAVDISTENIKVAKFNALRYGVLNNVEFKEGDLFSSITERKYDFIVSNPPYIKKRDLQELPPEVRYEPKIALNGKKEGMNIYTRLVDQAGNFLKSGSKMFLEINSKQKNLINNLIEKCSEFKIKKFCLDYRNRNRVVVIEKI